MEKVFRKSKRSISYILSVLMIVTQLLVAPLPVMGGEQTVEVFNVEFRDKTLNSGWSTSRMGWYGSTGSTPFAFKGNGSTLISQEFNLAEDGTLSFWLRSHESSKDAPNTSTLKVEQYINDTWTTAGAITLNHTGAGTVVDDVPEYTISKDATQIKFTYQKQGGNVAIDNIKLIYTGQPPASVELIDLDLPELEEMQEGQEKTISVTYIPEDTTEKGVTWSSSDEEVATIVNGKIKALSAGTTTITATSIINPNITKSVILTVAEKPAIPGVVVDVNCVDKKLPSGWVTSEPAEFYGGAPFLKMTGWYNLTSAEFRLLSEGTFSFDVKANNTKDANTGETLMNTSTIVVEQLLPSGWGVAEEIKLNMANAALDSKQVTLDSAARAIRIVYKKEGGNIAIDNFKITQAADAIEIPVTGLSLEDIEVGTEESKTILPIYEPSNTTQKWLTWSVEDSTIATVDQYGKVTGLKKGETSITIKSEVNENILATAKLVVNDAKGPVIVKASPKGSGVKKDASINIVLEDETGLDKESIKILLNDKDVTSLFTRTIKTGDESKILSYELSYKPELDFEEGTYTVKISAKDMLDFEMSEEWTFSVGEYKQGNLYFGQLHAHTNISDGTGTLEEAYTWAREQGKADYIAITDHSNWFDNDKEGTINDGSKSAKWVAAQSTSDQYNKDNEFVAMYGYEMTWSNGTGHMNTFNSEGFETRSNGSIDLKEYYSRLLTAPQSISQFNHPGTTFGDFKDFGFYSKEVDELVTLLEVGNGEGAIRGSGYFPSYEYYTRALDKGWHISPTNNQDNHKKGWVTANTARTVIEAKELTRDDLYDAMRQRRTYATENENLNINYTVNGQAMGSILDQPEELNISIKVEDPDVEDKISTISIIANGGAVVETKSFGTSTAEWNLTLSPEYSYYYVRVDMENGDIAVTAPVWAGETVPIGLSSIEASSAVLEVNEEFEVKTKAFNNTEHSLVNVKVEYFKDSLDHANKIGEATITSLNAAGVAEVNTKLTLDAVGEHNIYATTTLTVKGVAKVSTVSTKVKVLKPEEMLKVVVDGGHFNDYVSGDYPNNVNGFNSILAKREIKMMINAEKDSQGKFLPKAITDEVLENASLLILTGPESINGRSRNPYSADDIAAITRFAERGGNIIITSKGDRKNAKPEETEFRNAYVGNQVLEAIGSNLRLNDNLVVDAVTKENETWRLSFTKFRNDPYGLTKEIGTDDKYSFYSGCSVSVKDDGDVSKVFFPIQAHETTGAATSGYSDKALPPEDGTIGNIEVIGAEILSSGAKLIVSGSTFLSDFEVKGDNINANYTFTENVIDWMVTAPEAELVSIAQIHKEYPSNFGKRYAIEGVVTAQSEAVEPKNAFFEVVYIQDETGGLTIFGISQTQLQIGQKVRLTGVVGEYEGDRQIRVYNESKDVIVINESINKVAPKEMKTKEAMDSTNQGWLVKVTGKVTKMNDTNLWINDGSGDARVYVNGYIWDGINPDAKGKWDSTIKVGDTVSAIGLAAMDPDGPRLRVRNTSEIIKIKGTNTGGESSGDSSSGGGSSSNSSSSGGSSSNKKPVSPPTTPTISEEPKVDTPTPPIQRPIQKSVISINTGTLNVGGKEVTLYTKPFISNGRTVMGVRDIALIIGIANEDIGWDAKTQTVSFKKDGKVIEMVIGKKEMKVDGKVIPLDVAPVIVNGRTCIPVAHFARILGIKVEFNQVTKSVIFE